MCPQTKYWLPSVRRISERIRQRSHTFEACHFRTPHHRFLRPAVPEPKSITDHPIAVLVFVNIPLENVIANSLTTNQAATSPVHVDFCHGRHLRAGDDGVSTRL